MARHGKACHRGLAWNLPATPSRPAPCPWRGPVDPIGPWPEFKFLRRVSGVARRLHLEPCDAQRRLPSHSNCTSMPARESSIDA
eukprot:scaffold79_cov259-Pinguiococcus_pyrenoidosus.AAC.12